ncbi:MAG TPA: aldehyde dehydrogenase family protein, partial [Bacteroidota bacterium]|nr:aldehyde dehydrogenase family protein [Bacteroidota bacterium]
MAIATISPSTGKLISSFCAFTGQEVRQKLGCARDAFVHHRVTTFAERAGKMNEAARILETEKASFGKLMTLEMGKPVTAAMEEAVKSAWVCRYYA